MAPWNGDLWMIRNQTIYSYDIDSDAWTTWGSYSGGDDMNQTDNDYEGKIYGYAANGDVVIYDTVDNTVSQHSTGLGSLFETRLVYDPVYHSLFIGEYSQPQLYRFDLTTYSVTQLADIPENQLNDIFCGDRSGHIYAAGDSAGTTIFQYDIASNAWTQMPNLPANHGNNGSCTVSEEGYLYVASGSLRQLYRIDLGMN